MPATDRPQILLVHGAANSAHVWTFWFQSLDGRGWPAVAIDLRGHGARAGTDLSTTRMADYTEDVVAEARRLPRPPVLLGWSMGGLVAMMAARACAAIACVALAPSAPTRATDRSVPLRTGTFGAAAYGIRSSSLSAQPTMPDLDLEERRIALVSLGPESQLARDERAAGIVIEPLPCPLLIVTGTADTFWPRERYRDFPLPAQHLVADGASHWGLVLNRRVLATLVPAVLGWVEGHAGLTKR
jgi:pimeloyl-ACP methyl ester carboxylesterase